MNIYLVQSGGSLDGGDGYSYGLVKGGHPRLLVSFVDYMRTGQKTIHKNQGSTLNRRPLSKRALEGLKPAEEPKS
jgi:hypothetical protein